MVDIKFSFPSVLSIENLSEIGAANLAAKPDLVKQLLTESYNGIVTANGKWGKNTEGIDYCPGGDWSIEKLDVGLYKILHGMGYQNISLSVSIVQGPAMISIVENADSYFIVQTSVSNKKVEVSDPLPVDLTIIDEASLMPPLPDPAIKASQPTSTPVDRAFLFSLTKTISLPSSLP